MAKTTIYLDSRRPLADGRLPLKLSVFINGKGRFMLNTGVSVFKNQWSGKDVISHANKSAYNNVLHFKINRADDELIRMEISGELSKLSLAEIKQRITAIFASNINTASQDKDVLVNSIFESLIRSAVAEGTRSIYRQTLAKLGRYYDMSVLTFEEINVPWLREFEGKMREDNLSINAISVHLRNLRIAFNRALDDEIIINYPFRKFKIKTERTVKRSLTVEQLRTLRDYNCQPHQAKYRDIFMLIFYMVGINMVDLLALKEVREGRAEFRRAKTGRLYSIKVEPEALEIIERYRGEEFLLSARDNYANYRDFLKRTNKNLQEIGPLEWVENGARDPFFVKRNKKKITPLFPELSTYWARHTWATIAASLDIPKESIAAALGHGGNTVTDIYIDFDQRKVDAANRRVIDYINGLE